MLAVARLLAAQFPLGRAKRRAAGETLASIAKATPVISMISRLKA
jgi:hypothetical protein